MTGHSYYSTALAKELGGQRQVKVWLPSGRWRIVDILTKDQIIQVKMISSSSAERAHVQPEEYSKCVTDDGESLAGRELRVHCVFPNRSELQRRLSTMKSLNPDVVYTWELAVECQPVRFNINGTEYSPNELRRHCDRVIRLWPNHVDSDDLLVVLNLPGRHYSKVESRRDRLVAVKITGKTVDISNAIAQAIDEAKEAEITRRMAAAKRDAIGEWFSE